MSRFVSARIGVGQALVRAACPAVESLRNVNRPSRKRSTRAMTRG